MKLKRRTRQRQRISLKKLTLAVSLCGILLGTCATLYFNLANRTEAIAATNHEPVFAAGSYIIDLSEPKQSTKAAAFIWEMIRQEAIPVSWLPQASDNRFKTIDGVTYEEGALLVDSRFLVPAVAASIRRWENKGVKGSYLKKTHPVAGTIDLNAVPEFLIDTSGIQTAVQDSILRTSDLPESVYTLASKNHPTTGPWLSLQPADAKHPKPLLYSFIDGCLKKQLFVKINGPDQIKPGERIHITASVYGGVDPLGCEWSSSLGGRFEKEGVTGVTYSAPLNMNRPQTDLVRLRVHSADGREALVALPVTVAQTQSDFISSLDFRCYIIRSVAIIKWTVQKEVNTDYYLVERSVDGINWTMIARQNGTGSSTGASTYEVRDTAPEKGISTYRIRRATFDGENAPCATYNLNNVSIDDAKAKLDVAQTVFESSFAFTMKNPDNGTGELRLYTKDGLLVDKRNYSLQKGTQTLFYVHSNLKSGSYIAVFQSGKGNLYSAKVEKI